MKINWKKSIIAGVVAGIVYIAVGMLVWYLPSSYLMPLYEASARLWKPMEPMIIWQAQMWGLQLIEVIIFAAVFSLLYNGIPGKGVRKGLNYGFILWIVGTLPGMMLTYMTMAVPNAIVAHWLFGGLMELLIVGSVISLVYEKVK